MMLSEIDSLLWYSKATDQLLINCIDISEVNKPLIRKVGYNQNGTLRDEEYSLLSGVIQHNRLELAQHLIDKGAKMLFNEVGSVLRNGKVSDQFLISCFENTADINKPLIRKVSYDQGQTFQNEECSLLSEVIKHDRFKLAQHLIDKGAKMLLNEVESFLRNANVADELLISGINISDINKPLIRKVSYDQGQTFQNEECSLLEKVISFKRFELAKYLADKGAKILHNEVDSFLRNANVADELLISGINISDINKPLVKTVSYDQGQTFSNEEYSLLEEAIQSNRLELVQHLANNGADVNFESNAGKLYMMAYHKGIPFFDVLVSSNKLIKDPDMDSYNVNLGNQISLRLSDLYDVIMWKNNFNASLSDDFEQFDKWLNDGNIHSVKSLFNAFQKFSNIKINCSEECSDAFKKAQEKYGKEVISQKTNEINESIFKN